MKRRTGWCVTRKIHQRLNKNKISLRGKLFNDENKRGNKFIWKF